MQEKFRSDAVLVQKFKASLSQQRFSTYMRAHNNDEVGAIAIYQWNSRLSQALYIYLQTWEICLRNKLNDFLSWKYNPSWPYDNSRAVRQLKNNDKKRLLETIERQQRERKMSPVSTSAIVADLSAGFWVSQLSSSYEIPYKWRHNVARVFPNEKTMDAATAWKICDDLLTLRNRVAHHEPIFHLPLLDRRSELARMVAAMCDASSTFAEATCNFASVWKDRP